MSFPTTLVKEGAATFHIPRIPPLKKEHIDRARSKAPVFFNERMQTNRDSAVLALGVHGKRLSRPLTMCDPMCGTGVRGIRLALEVKEVRKVVMGDLNPKSVILSERNIVINRVTNRVDVNQIDANLLLSLHAKPLSRFDYIDIDPYGSPAQYLDSAIMACVKHGLIALTATDMAPLCGVNPKACLRKYGGRSLRTNYSHELALRFIAGAMVRRGAVHEIAPLPVFSYAADHYVRLNFVLERGKKKADSLLNKIGYILHCFTCLNRITVPMPIPDGSLKCKICGSEMKTAGPLWIGELNESSFCNEMEDLSKSSQISSNKQLMRILHLVQREIGLPPGYFYIDRLCSKHGLSSISTRKLITALREHGYKAEETHINRRGIKTDASISELEDLL